MERKGRFQGSIWLGIKGLRWALGELGKLKSIPATQTGVFQFMRDGYRTLEFSCLSNRGGRFVELSAYHGGAQKGSIRVPEGRYGAGWDRFGYEIRKYFLTKFDSSSAPPSDGDIQAGPARRSTQGFRNRNWRNNNCRNSNARPSMKSRDSRGGNKSADLAPGVRSGESRHKLNEVQDRVILSDLEPRPTRKFEFKWVLGKKTLRVTKSRDGPREVTWVRPETKSHEPNPQLKNTRDLDQPNDPIEVGHLWNEEPLQKHLEASGETQCETNSMGQPDEPIEEVPTVAELANEEEGVYSDEDVDTVAELVNEEDGVHSEEDADAEILGDLHLVTTSVAPSESMSHALVRVDLAENIHFEELDEVLGLGSTLELAVPSVSMGLELEDMDYVARPPIQELSETNADPQSPMVCKPLAIIEPSEQKMLVPGNSGEKIRKGGKRSKWVNHQYREICKLMGFPIDSHEQQCLDLLRKIEATRNSKRGEMSLRKATASKSKGVRKLKNLASSVNYEGKRRTC